MSCFPLLLPFTPLFLYSFTPLFLYSYFPFSLERLLSAGKHAACCGNIIPARAANIDGNIMLGQDFLKF
jgi:hypothetical protein